jgi:Leucine Rich Repeat
MLSSWTFAQNVCVFFLSIENRRKLFEFQKESEAKRVWKCTAQSEATMRRFCIASPLLMIKICFDLFFLFFCFFEIEKNNYSFFRLLASKRMTSKRKGGGIVDLSGKGLDVVPAEVYQQRDLIDELNLSNNAFVKLPKKFAANFKQDKKDAGSPMVAHVLSSLDLSHNQLTKLPNNFGYVEKKTLKSNEKKIGKKKKKKKKLTKK